MKKELSSARLRELMDYDPLTGEFTWKGRVGRGANCRTAYGTKAGHKNGKGYVVISVDGLRGVKAHRLAWLYMTGEWPSKQIDHIDNVRHNNAWGNLRQASQFENSQNQRKPSKNNKSGYLGVTWDGKAQKWAATICVNGRNKRLGRHKTAIAAHSAYMEAKRIYHPFFVAG